MPDETRTIRLFGELELPQARSLGATLSEAIGDTRRELVVDLRRVTFMDSTALGALVRAGERLRRQGRALRVILLPGGQVEGLLETTGLADRFERVSALPGTAAGPSTGPEAAA